MGWWVGFAGAAQKQRSRSAVPAWRVRAAWGNAGVLTDKHSSDEKIWWLGIGTEGRVRKRQNAGVLDTQ